MRALIGLLIVLTASSTVESAPTEEYIYFTFIPKKYIKKILKKNPIKCFQGILIVMNSPSNAKNRNINRYISIQRRKRAVTETERAVTETERAATETERAATETGNLSLPFSIY